MAKVTLKYGELYSEENQERIVVTAAQSGRFLKEVNRQLKNGFGRNRGQIAQHTVNEAIAGINKIFRSGLTGASSHAGRSYSGGTKSTYASIRGVNIGNVSLSTRYQDLARSTVKRKRGRVGSGRFWRDGSGKRASLNSLAAEAMSNVKVSYSTEVLGVEIRRGPERIDFTVTIEIGEMEFPFDELVRRPLITGEPLEGVKEYEGNRDADVFLLLEFGTKDGKIPARPWISEISAKVGLRLFDELLTEPS